MYRLTRGFAVAVLVLLSIALLSLVLRAAQRYSNQQERAALLLAYSKVAQPLSELELRFGLALESKQGVASPQESDIAPTPADIAKWRSAIGKLAKPLLLANRVAVSRLDLALQNPKLVVADSAHLDATEALGVLTAVHMLQRALTLQLSEDLQRLDPLNFAQWPFIEPALFMLAVAMLVWLWRLATKQHRVAARVGRVFEHIRDSYDLSVRVPAMLPTSDIGVLVSNFNRLMDSLERDVAQGRQQAESKLWVAAGLAQLERVRNAELGCTATVMAMLTEMHRYTSAQHVQWYQRNAATGQMERVQSQSLRTWLADADSYPGYAETIEASIKSELPLSIKLEPGQCAEDEGSHAAVRTAVAMRVTEGAVFYGVVVLVFFVTPLEKVMAYLNRAAKVISAAASSASASEAQQRLNDDLKLQQDAERRRFELLVGSMVDGMAVTDTAGLIAYANPALLEWLGYDFESLRKKPFKTLFATTETDLSITSEAPLAERSDTNGLQTGVVDRAGQVHPAEVSIRRLETIDGPVLGITLHDIAEQVEREARIAYDAAFQAALIDAIPNPIMVKDAGGVVVSINRAHEQMFGVKRSAVAGKASWASPTFLHLNNHLSLSPQEIIELDRKVLATGRPVSMPVQIASNSDGVRDCIYLKVPLDLLGHGRVGVVTQFIDVTGLREAERRVLSSNQLLESVARNLPLGVFQLRENAKGVTTFSYANPNFPALLRTTREKLAIEGKDALFSRLEPNDAQMLEKAMRELQDSIQLTGRFDFGDRIGWINISLTRSTSVRESSLPAMQLWTGYINDITESKLAQESRLEQSDFLQKIIDALPVGVAVKDNNRRFFTANTEAQRLFGMPRSQMLGQTTLELKKAGARLEIPDPVLYAELEDDVIDGGERRESEIITTDELGNTINLILLRLPIVLPQGLTTQHDQARKGLIIISQNVTKFRAQEASILQSNELLQRIANNVPGAIFEITIDNGTTWHFSYVSNGLESMLGVVIDEIYSDATVFSKNVLPSDKAQLDSFLLELCANAPRRSEIEFRYRAGDTTRHALAVVTRTRNADLLEKHAYTGYLSDITERKQAMQNQANQAALLNSLIEALPLPVYAKTRDLRYSMANRAYCELIGVLPGQLLKRQHHEISSPLIVNSGATAQDNLIRQQQLLTDAGSFDLERIVTDAAGVQRDTNWLYRPFSVSGAAEGLICVVVDLTEARSALRVAEGAQQVAETARRQLFQTTANVPVVIFEGQSNFANDYPIDPGAAYRWNFISPSLFDLLGVTHARALADASSAFERVNLQDQVRLNEYFAALESQSEAIAEIEFKAEVDGSERRLKMVTRLLERDAQAPSIRWVGYIDDVTAERERADDLRRAMATAEEAATVKAMFLANMSHEIRTPLNAVIGMTYLALRTELSQKQFDYLTKIRNAGTSLQALINDILDFSKIEAGKMSVEAASFDLSRSLANISANHAVQAEDKFLQLEFDIDPLLPLVVVGDAARIEQVLNNLFSNALKFTDQGKVSLSVRVKTQQAEQLTLLFCVQDSGIGISLEQQGRLFQAFVQADGSTTRKYGGTGLGLSISRKLVELMGGEIWIESEPGIGSKFFWTVVVRRATAADFRLVTGALQKRAVDVVVPDVREREHLRRRLTSLRVRSRWWTDFDNFVAFIAKNPAAVRPWLFVSQKALDLDVSSVQEQLARWMLLAPQTQLVVLSHLQAEQRSEQLYSLGAASVLVWPYGLTSVCDAFMRDAPAVRGVSASNDEHAQFLRGTRVLLAEDNLINQQIAVEMLSSVGCTVSVANNGQEALDLLLASDSDALPFDVVLMDLQMPVMDGWATVARIRATPAWANLPILALTAHALGEEVVRTRQAGMIDHITKPIDASNLYTAITKALNRSDALPVSKHDISDLHGAAGSDVRAGNKSYSSNALLIDFAAGLLRVSGNQALYLRLLRQFAEGYADAADQMMALLERNEIEQCLMRLHNLKGVSGNISANRVQDLAARAEVICRRGVTDSAARDMCKALALALTATCSAIAEYRNLHQHITAQKLTGTLTGKIALTEGLLKLTNLLEQQDANAQDALLAIQAELQVFLTPENWHTLQKAIDQWQFSQALAVLEDIKQKLPFAP